MQKESLTIARLKAIVRAYDIRGQVSEQLSEEEAYLLGIALSTYLKKSHSQLKVVLGMDNRLSSESLKRALIAGLVSEDLEIVDLGLTVTPALYHAALTNPTHKLGIMVTASHNPPNYNGFKIIWEGQILDGEALKKIIHNLSPKIDNLSNSYFDWLLTRSGLKNYQEQKGLKILWDCNFGATQNIIKLIKDRIVPDSRIVGLSEYLLESPDPATEKRIAFIIKELTREACDLAFCFDGDGDRLLLITRQGKILRGDQILLLYCKYFQKDWLGQTIVVDIKTSPEVVKQLGELGYQVVVEKTGHSFIKKTMLATKAQIGGEVSGHLFFTYNNYPYDDAILAALLLLEIYIKDPGVFQLLLDDIKSFPALYDFKIPCQDHLKDFYMKKIIDIVQARKSKELVLYLDGVKSIDDKGSWLLRASNTEAAIILCLEGYSKKFFLDKLDEINIILVKAGLEPLSNERIDKKQYLDNSVS